MKILAVLALPLLFSSCALVQLPARIVSQVLGPLTTNETANSAGDTMGVALEYSRPAPGR